MLEISVDDWDWLAEQGASMEGVFCRERLSPEGSLATQEGEEEMYVMNAEDWRNLYAQGFDLVRVGTYTGERLTASPQER